MNKNIRYLITVAAVIILIFLIVGISKIKKSSPPPSTQGTSPTEEVKENLTHLAVPENISVPETNQETTLPDVAKPISVSPAAPQSDRSLRKFEIKAEGNKFTPKEIIVYEKDIVRINITAVDKDYDWALPDYGFNVKIVKSATQTVEFQATTVGKFIFYCESCGGLKSSAIGYVTVVPAR